MRQLARGIQAPDFELPDVNGVPHRLWTALNLNHGPVVLVFFKISCPTSQFTFPYIQKIFATAAKGWRLKLWAVSQDDADDTRQFAQQYGITFDTLIDAYPYDVSNAYRIVTVPATFIVEPNGKISLSDNGFSKDSLNQIAGYDMFTPDDGLPASRPG
jgi:peroxiredoxin